MSPAPGQTVADLGERAAIERVRARLPAPPPWVLVGIGDDAAVIAPARNHLEVLTTDALVEGIHFDRAYVPPAAIGHKALAANLSDLAAMGAQPRAALLSLILPAALNVAALDALLDGWLALATRHDVALIGGNVSRSPGPLVVDVTAVGAVRPRRALTRGGARPGDDLYVSGSVGGAHAGRLALRQTAAGGAADPWMAVCEAQFLAPEPRVRLGLLLARNRVATSCVDLSDGLGDAVRQLAMASRVGAIVEADRLPLPDPARRWFEEREKLDPVAAAVAGGEDYELLFTVGARRRRALAAVLRQAGGLPCTRIGTVTAARALVLRRAAGTEPLPAGFAHFR
jgi:thiamine-monophosphate kinase